MNITVAAHKSPLIVMVVIVMMIMMVVMVLVMMIVMMMMMMIVMYEYGYFDWNFVRHWFFDVVGNVLLNVDWNWSFYGYFNWDWHFAFDCVWNCLYDWIWMWHWNLNFIRDRLFYMDLEEFRLIIFK